MQKWCPEAFDATSALVFRDDGPSFEPIVPAGLPAAAVDAEVDRGFRSERGLGDPATIMNHLSPRERTMVCELVEQDVARVYAEREAALRTELEQAMQAELARVQQAQQAFAENWRQETDRRLQELAAASARLALQVAGKLVRRVVQDDREVLVRAIETVFYGAGTREPLTVTVHPDDAAWLESDPELTARLRIGSVVADRRVEQGGCLIAADGREWDATLGSQLESIGEVVEEWLATAGGPGAPKESDA
jgi:flagellar biosynthesis/type III secretory pathway protein FliH